ncbi:hypothetical protein QL285_044318 [Trifolium repens]|nr:hypothetical protein QL285_044318 [Trifolium repens]
MNLMLKARKLIQETQQKSLKSSKIVRSALTSAKQPFTNQSSHLVSSIFKPGYDYQEDDWMIGNALFTKLLVWKLETPDSSPSVSIPDISYESTLFLDFPVQHHRPNSDHDGTLHNSQIDHNETSITIASDPTDDVVHDKHTEPDEIILRKSSRVSKPPGYLKDFHCNMATTTGNNLQERNQAPQRLWHLAL